MRNWESKKQLYFFLILALVLTVSEKDIFCQVITPIIADSFHISENHYRGESAIEYRNSGNGVDQVIQSKSIVYYGIDFSRMTFTDIDIVGKESIIQKYFPAWIANFSKAVPAEDEIEKKFRGKKEKFVFETSLDEIQMLYKHRLDNWIKFEANNFDIDSLRSIISSYELVKKFGIGFVIIPSNFNKPQKIGKIYYVFFDINSRRILWASLISAKPGGWGLTDYWSESLKNSYKYFIRFVYK